MITVKASDRTYVQMPDGSLRVLNYDKNGVENSEIFIPNSLSEIAEDVISSQNPTN